MHGQTTNQRYRGDAVLEYLIVDSNEERPHILSLGEMLVEAFVEGGDGEGGDCVLVALQVPVKLFGR